MSKVLTMQGKVVEGRPMSMDAADAREALRALLDKLDKGEIAVDRWLFLYDEQMPDRPDYAKQRYLDSGIDLADCLYIVETFKLGLLLSARDLVP